MTAHEHTGETPTLRRCDRPDCGRKVTESGRVLCWCDREDGPLYERSKL